MRSPFNRASLQRLLVFRSNFVQKPRRWHSDAWGCTGADSAAVRTAKRPDYARQGYGSGKMAEHITEFWDPRMRKAIVAYIEASGADEWRGP
jgi:hypothetical protein